MVLCKNHKKKIKIICCIDEARNTYIYFPLFPLDVFICKIDLYNNTASLCCFYFIGTIFIALHKFLWHFLLDAQYSIINM
jgi:hypothetical protein